MIETVKDPKIVVLPLSFILMVLLTAIKVVEVEVLASACMVAPLKSTASVGTVEVGVVYS